MRLLRLFVVYLVLSTLSSRLAGRPTDPIVANVWAEPTPPVAVKEQGRIVNCQGTWQNKPCGAGIDSAPSTTASEPPSSPERQSQSKRKLWIHDLEMLRIKAKRDYQIVFSPREVEEICNNKNSSELECQQIISAKQLELTTLIQQAEHLKLEQERNKIEQEKLKKPAGDGTTNIANDNRTVIFIRPSKHRSHNQWNSPENLPVINGSKGSSSSAAAIADQPRPPTEPKPKLN